MQSGKNNHILRGKCILFIIITIFTMICYEMYKAKKENYSKLHEIVNKLEIKLIEGDFDCACNNGERVLCPNYAPFNWEKYCEDAFKYKDWNKPEVLHEQMD